MKINTPSFSIRFNAQAGQYSLADSGTSATFGQAQFQEETGVPDYYPRVDFERDTPGAIDYLTIFKAPNALPPVLPKYGAYGAWQHNTANGGATNIRINYFAYGSPTPVANMPHAGTVKYRITGTGNLANGSELYFVTTDTRVTVDFASGSITAQVSLSGTDFFGGGVAGLASFNISGTISGNGVDGSTDSNIAAQTGSFHLQFTGSNADELELVYEAMDPSQAFVGAAIGTRIS